MSKQVAKKSLPGVTKVAKQLQKKSLQVANQSLKLMTHNRHSSLQQHLIRKLTSFFYVESFHT
jgi:hypothetical protein